MFQHFVGFEFFLIYFKLHNIQKEREKFQFFFSITLSPVEKMPSCDQHLKDLEWFLFLFVWLQWADSWFSCCYRNVFCISCCELVLLSSFSVTNTAGRSYFCTGWLLFVSFRFWKHFDLLQRGERQSTLSRILPWNVKVSQIYIFFFLYKWWKKNGTCNFCTSFIIPFCEE